MASNSRAASFSSHRRHHSCAPVKAHLTVQQGANPVKMPPWLPKRLTVAGRFFPILLTAASRQPKFATKNGLIAHPESTHRCISCNNGHHPDVWGLRPQSLPFKLTLAAESRIGGVPNPLTSCPASAHRLPRSPSPACPAESHHDSRKASPHRAETHAR